MRIKSSILQIFYYIKNKTKIHFDKIFIALHGPPAENGLIQNYFDSIKLPYTSCNAHVSSLTFNKFACNNMLKSLGFKCADSIIINSEFSENKIINAVGLPCFVKPNQSGSSYGISKVTKISELSKAIKQALLHDNDVLIEKFIEGKEMSCGVYANKNNIIPLPITEIISENDFFDYEAKYEGKSKEITPANISDELTKKIQAITVDVYKKNESFWHM